MNAVERALDIYRTECLRIAAIQKVADDALQRAFADLFEVRSVIRYTSLDGP